MITVYHQKHPQEIDPDSKERQWDPMVPNGKPPPPWPEMYVAVARVNTTDLEEAWEKTNHIYYDWTQNIGVEVLQASRHRSSMVGDIFDTGGQLFVANGIGFKPLDDFSKPKKESENGA